MRSNSSKDANVQKIIEEWLKKEAQEDIANEELIPFSELKLAAKTFLEEINLYTSIINHQNLVKRIEAVKSLTKVLYGDMRASNQYTQNILLAYHTFEATLNKFLNREIHLTYVTQEGELISYSDLATGQLYSMATGNFGRGNISEGKIKNFIDKDENIKTINEQLKKSANNKREVYTKALKRWQNNTNKNDEDYNPVEKTFFWKKTPSKWEWTGRISNKGMIAEGYAEAVINNHDDINNAFLERSLETLWKKYITKDNIPAAVKGDIILQGTNVQFAIKQGSFSTAKIGQYINLAYNITQLNDSILRQQLYLALPKLLSLTQTSQKIINIMNSEAEDTIAQIIKESVSGKQASVNFYTDLIHNI